MRTADLLQHVDQDLYGAYGVAQVPEAGLQAATLEQLPEVGRFTALRNLLYAIEWWFFGAFAAFIWWRHVTRGRGIGTGGARGRGRPGTFGAVISLFNAYRVLAFVVGVLLAFCSAGALLKYLARGHDLQQFGEYASIMWVVHGWVFMIYVVVAFLLSRRADWSIGFTLVTLVAGLVPLLIFWVEHRVTRKVRAEHPELVGSVRPER